MSDNGASKCQRAWPRSLLLAALPMARCSGRALPTLDESRTMGPAATASVTPYLVVLCLFLRLGDGGPPAAARRGLVRGCCTSGPCTSSGTAGAAGCTDDRIESVSAGAVLFWVTVVRSWKDAVLFWVSVTVLVNGLSQRSCLYKPTSLSLSLSLSLMTNVLSSRRWLLSANLRPCARSSNQRSPQSLPLAPVSEGSHRHLR